MLREDVLAFRDFPDLPEFHQPVDASQEAPRVETHVDVHGFLHAKTSRFREQRIDAVPHRQEEALTLVRREIHLLFRVRIHVVTMKL